MSELFKTYILSEFFEIVKREGVNPFGCKYDVEELVEYIIEYWKGKAEYWEHEAHEANAVLEDPSLKVVH